MAIGNSRIPGLKNLSVAERRELLADLASLSAEQRAAWAATGELDEESADRMIENVVGTYSLPIGVATNFVVDGLHYVIPYVIEEPSVVAAASNIAKRCLSSGGFKSQNDNPVMIGQIQIVACEDTLKAEEAVMAAKTDLITKANKLDPILVELGGGCKDIIVRTIDTDSGPMVIVHVLVDCRDAMGANAVNTIVEEIAPQIEGLVGGRAILKIISNLAVHRLARVSAVFTPEEMSDKGNDREQGLSIIEGVIQACHFAKADPFRATTNNKGIMNAISAIALACGQDWRAIESGAHSYAAYERSYTSLTDWSKDNDGNLVGSIELPMAVGLVGGSVYHPSAQANVALLGVKTADELAKVMAAAGLAQNLGALRALATVGIQAGHMKLHVRNMAVTAGAQGDEVDIISASLRDGGRRITQALVNEALQELRLARR